MNGPENEYVAKLAFREASSYYDAHEMIEALRDAGYTIKHAVPSGYVRVERKP